MDEAFFKEEGQGKEGASGSAAKKWANKNQSFQYNQ